MAARHVAHSHPRSRQVPLLKAIGDLAAVAGGDLTHLPALQASWPKAIQQVNENL